MSSLIKNCGVKNDDVPDFDAYVVWVLFVLLGLLLSVKEKMQIIMAGEKVCKIDAVNYWSWIDVIKCKIVPALFIGFRFCQVCYCEKRKNVGGK